MYWVRYREYAHECIQECREWSSVNIPFGDILKRGPLRFYHKSESFRQSRFYVSPLYIDRLRVADFVCESGVENRRISV